jgi:hypothetical protein
VSYHSIHLRFPNAAPFDGETWFETFAGRFVKPLLETGQVQQYWFTRYGSPDLHEIRLRVATESFSTLNPLVQEKVREFHFTNLHDELNETLTSSLGGTRFLSPDASNQLQLERAQLTFNFLHSLSALYLASLVGPDASGRFRQERNTERNNPHGSIFETLHHLFCNVTDVVTEVEAFKAGEALGFNSPLYASQTKAQLASQGIAVTDCCKIRIRF